MKLKKQFNLLAIFITAIPLACLLFVCINMYLRSQKNLLLTGSDEVRALDSSNMTKEDYNLFLKNVRLLPKDVETALIDNTTGLVIISSIKEIPINTYLSQFELWMIMEGTSNKYFYQFTTLNTFTLNSMMITRVPRKKSATSRNQYYLPILYTVVTLIVLICIAIIIILSGTINRSIKMIEDTTQELANGNLGNKIPAVTKKPNEITSILESLEKMRISLVEAQNQKTKFIMGISHDLRTPVAVIKGYTEAITDGVISEKEDVKNATELITTKAKQLENMIDTLINFTKLNSTEIRETMKTQSITEFISEITREEQTIGNVFNRTIVLNVNFDKEVLVPFDKQLVTRVFENLFNNALRYTRDNDTITLESYIDEEKRAVIYNIKDTGIGIDQKDLKNIFELFYRGTDSRLEEGMGIGLSVVKNIIETHCWNISVDSVKGKGTCFTITIPFK
ncbi:MAG: HAMP domain-containing histidine kinase [Treponema sp.]|nr:HAMP domain-containing histidine kinase [Treponema sp.]